MARPMKEAELNVPNLCLAGMGFEVFGVLLGNIIFGFIITKYRVTPSNSDECVNGTIVSGNGSDISTDQRRDAVRP